MLDSSAFKDDITCTMNPSSVEWKMDWSGLNKDGTRRHPDKPLTEMMFEPERAVALLLINEAIFLNSNWHRDDLPEADKNSIVVLVNCNDVFVWGCSDAEEMSYSQIKDVYQHWIKDPIHGCAIWCMKQRTQLPQRPVLEDIKKAGIWNIDELTKEHGLRANYYDGHNKVTSTIKYKAYCEWCLINKTEPRVFDKNWWIGWRDYIHANPDYYDAAWRELENTHLREFRQLNGYEEPKKDDPATTA